jgi:hypothetical protein
MHRFSKLVRHHERGHHCEARIADLAELAAQIDDALVDILGKCLQVILLPILASETELTAGNGGNDL